MNEISDDDKRIREVITIAKNAADKGNRPFGALLVAADGAVLARGENTQASDQQVLAHAEMNLLHEAVQNYGPDVLGHATLYTSAEPCAMCTGAMFWSGIGRLVFGLSNERLHEIQGATSRMLGANAAMVLSGAGRHVEVVGPVLEDEAEALFTDS